MAAGGFDCLITDLLMPRMTGIQLVQALQDRGDNTPAIVVSAG